MKKEDKPTLREEANSIVAYAFRNGFLEDLHAGTSPSSKKRDYSDVKIISPFGKILWKDLSRLSDEEMKKLMIETCKKVEVLLTLKEQNPKDFRKFVLGYNKMYTQNWEK